MISATICVGKAQPPVLCVAETTTDRAIARPKFETSLMGRSDRPRCGVFALFKSKPIAHEKLSGVDEKATTASLAACS